MKKRKTTNILLLIIALPVIFYILKLLSFIFIPLVFSMFIALLFLPLMRWLRKRKIPKTINLIIVIIIIGLFFKLTSEIIQLSSKEIIASENGLIAKAESKLETIIIPLEKILGIERSTEKRIIVHYFQKFDLSKNFGSSIDFIGNLISMTLMTAFFTILLLAESLNFQKVLNSTLFKQKISSIKVFMRIEKDLITFLKVKFIISFFTGLGFTLACYFFDVSFPIFWGLLAFVINFVQMIGSVISVLLLSLFAFVEIDTTSILLFFILTITLVQVIMGGILEPIFMGKSFSINVITILVMLMFWGFIWGIPGLILAIPITVFIKIILSQFPKTKIFANLITGSELINIK
ncbi:AI-2E family transporter [Lutibacter sp.]|uniref:AI-2E family transporter n=1 Tax=Lutibacter sp. TaxID=1925666 RepID=UPI0025BE9103|nr:AI-2E family transporter [Lutibacter sp.]MCF6182844.1 AI-2E family transporter [Lutibacter sp.]